jgi:hypothetical protein
VVDDPLYAFAKRYGERYKNTKASKGYSIPSEAYAGTFWKSHFIFNSKRSGFFFDL